MRPFAVTFDETVPEIGIGSENTVEDAGGVGEGGKRVAEGDEEVDDEVVLFEAFADDVGVELVEVEGGLAGSEEGRD